MYTLIFTGLMLYSFGLLRTLIFYIGVLLSIVTLVFEMVAGGGLTYLFWPEWMSTFELGHFWVNSFIDRPNFQLWEAGAVPIIFVGDLFTIALRLVFTRCTVFTLGFFAFWLYCMFLLWVMVLAMVVQGGGKK